ncbi:MAG: IPTL-CTERM sorting domain-containing protein [Thermodesulfobacteriota bacterium]
MPYYLVEYEVVSNPIPSISEWGLIAMAGVMGMTALLVVRRRKVAA